MFSGILDNQMETPKPLRERFQSLNRSLCRSLSDHKFICFTMAEIDTNTKKLRLASCGSPYPLHVHNGEVTELKRMHTQIQAKKDRNHAKSHR